MESDFLTHLAQQSLASPAAASSDVVRPRLATRFEPARPLSPLHALQEQNEEVETESDSRRQAAQDAHALEASRHTDASLATIRPEHVSQLASSPRGALADSESVYALPHFAAAETFAQPYLEEQRAELPHTMESPSLPSKRIEDPGAQPGAAKTQGESPPSTPPGAPAPLEVRALSLSPQSLPAQREAARTGEQPLQQSAAAEPTIVVTIGRVEVRAVVAPAAQSAARQGAPIMTLEEYARRRSQQGNA